MAFALCEKNSIFAPNSYLMNGKTPHIQFRINALNEVVFNCGECLI